MQCYKQTKHWNRQKEMAAERVSINCTDTRNSVQYLGSYPAVVHLLK